MEYEYLTTEEQMQLLQDQARQVERDYLTASLAAYNQEELDAMEERKAAIKSKLEELSVEE